MDGRNVTWDELVELSIADGTPKPHAVAMVEEFGRYACEVKSTSGYVLYGLAWPQEKWREIKNGLSLTNDEMAEAAAQYVVNQYAIRALNQKGVNTMDLNDIAKGISRDKARAIVKPNNSKDQETVTLKWTEFVTMFKEMDEGMKTILEYSGEAYDLQGELDSAPSLFVNAYKELRKKKDVVIFKSQENAFGHNMDLLLKDVRVQANRVRGEYAAKMAAQRNEWIPVKAEHGEVFVPRWKWALIEAGVKRGRHTLLVGPPGTGKTELGRAVADTDGREFFHFEVSGFTDVSQWEAERIITSKDGSPHMELRPTPFIQALEAVKAGKRVLLYIDEIKRVGDPAILNTLMLLLAQGEYHSVVSKEVYNVTKDNFVVFASANDAKGFNFSGNSKRGLDDALADRFRRVELTPPPGDLMAGILKARIPDAEPRQCQDVALVYTICQKHEELNRFGVRAAVGLLDDWVSLGKGWEIEDVLDYCFPGDPKKIKLDMAAM